MTPRYAAHVSIGGTALAETWDGSAIVAVDDITVKWGRADIYDPVKPATLTMSVLDPAGAYVGSNALFGQAIVVTRDPGVVVFRGRIDSIAIRRALRRNPITGALQNVWMATLTASDALAGINRIVLPGPGSGSTSSAAAADVIYGQQHWPYDFHNNRIRGTSGMIVAGLSAYVVDARGPNYEGLGIPTAELDELQLVPLSMADANPLSMLEAIYSVVPLGHVNYDPDTQVITPGLPANAADVGFTLDPATLEVLDGSVFSTVPQNIARVRIDAYPREQVTVQLSNGASVNGLRWNRQAFEFAVPGAAATGATLTVAPDIWQDKQSETSEETGAVTYLGNKYVSVVSRLNGIMRFPPLRYNFERFNSGDPALDALLLGVQDNRAPLHIPGSVFADLPALSEHTQLIGGTLRYKAGWTVDMTLAPAVPAA